MHNNYIKKNSLFLCLFLLDIRNESPLKIKVQENSFNNHEIASNKDKLSDENVLTEVI